jgi:hypothetical protein
VLKANGLSFLDDLHKNIKYSHHLVFAVVPKLMEEHSLVQGCPTHGLLTTHEHILPFLKLCVNAFLLLQGFSKKKNKR